MNKPRLSAIIPISLALLLIFPLLALAQEEITITTYYPSPHGVYQELRLYPTDTPPSECNEANEGAIYYDSNTKQIMVCSQQPDFSYDWLTSSGVSDQTIVTCSESGGAFNEHLTCTTSGCPSGYVRSSCSARMYYSEIGEKPALKRFGAWPYGTDACECEIERWSVVLPATLNLECYTYCVR